jgi:hypothetical protein
MAILPDISRKYDLPEITSEDNGLRILLRLQLDKPATSPLPCTF